MFYPIDVKILQSNVTSALVSLLPSESKRLIARAVTKLPEVKQAMQDGLIIIPRGTTNAFVVEELTGVKIKSKADEYCWGILTGGEIRINTKIATMKNLKSSFVLRRGKVEDIPAQEAIKGFTANDVFIKGANAIDSAGEAAVFVGGTDGGTVGWALPQVISRGAHIIVAAGLEKLIPSVSLAAQKCGVLRFKYSTGFPCGLFPITNAKVVTEIQAFAILAGVVATPVASGGIGGSEGIIVLSLEGAEADIDRAMQLVKTVKGEPPVAAPEKVNQSAADFNYDPIALQKGLMK